MTRTYDMERKDTEDIARIQEVANNIDVTKKAYGELMKEE